MQCNIILLQANQILSKYLLLTKIQTQKSENFDQDTDLSAQLSQMANHVVHTVVSEGIHSFFIKKFVTTMKKLLRVLKFC